MQFHLVNGWRHTSHIQQILKLLYREIADSYSSSLSGIIECLHCFPCAWYVRFCKMSIFYAHWPVNLRSR
ncbi:hypothetical protein MtrunA17_Chr4g0009591 [Medicago truncatula]|uniref:Uncharacterized protein n=1 Tax=Medicago truncatula TaxID=3880 RepID=A0A396I2U9_MEDTR|nr:hypothetical protein MtrunA17_Chr4g0009591 [Medicago truncatula]